MAVTTGFPQSSEHSHPDRSDLHVEEHGFRVPLHMNVDPVFNPCTGFDTLGNQRIAAISGN